MPVANSTSRTMKTFIALLRAVNLGKCGMIAMTELRALLEKVGYADVKTLLQSGNIVFKAEASTAVLEKQLEHTIKQRFSYEVPCCVRTPAEWKKIVATNPFPREAQNDPSHLLVLFLKKSRPRKRWHHCKRQFRAGNISRRTGANSTFFIPIPSAKRNSPAR
jgi:uncharacterized protein (DUF1697 family)